VLFSIITPSHNYDLFVGETLASVAHQSRPDVEHIVVDDGSTDGSRDILRKARGIKLIEQENRGLASALNRGLLSARGEWIGWLNADDFYLPRALDRVARAIEANTSVDAIFGDTLFVDETGRFLRLLPAHRPSRVVFRWYGPFISTSAVFIRRDLVERAGGFQSDTRFLMDWWLYLAILEQQAKFAYLPAAISAYRRHPLQQSVLRYPGDASEYARLRRRFGLPGHAWSVTFGRAIHGALKLADGSYRRQWQLRRSCQGRVISWTARPEDETSCIEQFGTTEPYSSRRRI
jgi:glycosyltransferase involved in cell wall biosynthesis